MMELFNGIRLLPTKRCATRCLHRKKGCTVDSLDSVWFGVKLGVAIIGMVMMRFAWRGIWRTKRVEHKER